MGRPPIIEKALTPAQSATATDSLAILDTAMARNFLLSAAALFWDRPAASPAAIRHHAPQVAEIGAAQAPERLRLGAALYG